ncbi:putative RNA helicase [Helianthus debilis subsp. tardiflorus]
MDCYSGLLKDVQKKRSQNFNGESGNYDHVKKDNNAKEKSNEVRKLNSLKLISMSASLDARGFSEYFGGAKVVHVMGRQFPVDILYTVQPETECLDAALVTIFQLGKLKITSEVWSKCALCQVVSRDMFFHSRKYSIGVVLSLAVSILFPSTALSKPTVYEKFSRHNAIFFLRQVLDCSCTSTSKC